MKTTREKLLDIGEILGTDTTKAINVWTFFDDVDKECKDGNEMARRVLDALDLVYDAITLSSDLCV